MSELPIIRSIVTLLVLSWFVGGCRSRPAPPERLPPQPALYGEAVFESTGLLVSAELGPTQPVRPSRAEGGEKPEGGKPDRPDRGSRGSGGGGRPERSGDSAGRTAMRATRTPAHQLLTVTVHNPSAEPVPLRVAETKSLLGNFVPVPNTFSLEPGASQTLESVRGHQPVNFESLDLSVRIRTIETDETQTILLTLRPEPPPEP